MEPKKKEIRDVLRLGMKTLISQEVRLLRMERTFTPHFIIDEMSRSIQATKGSIARIARKMGTEERAGLLKRLMRQTLNEEIDRAIALRKTTCIRCQHGRFYDESGTAHRTLPTARQAQSFGCDRLRPDLRAKCRRFVESSMASSLDDYLNEITLLYEFKDLIDRMNEIWKDYLTR